MTKMVTMRSAALAIGLAGAMAAMSMAAANAQQWNGSQYHGAYDSAYDSASDSGYGGGFGGGYRGSYGSSGRVTAPGSYYSYGADRANPSTDPSGYDLDNARDRQLNGHN